MQFRKQSDLAYNTETNDQKKTLVENLPEMAVILTSSLNSKVRFGTKALTTCINDKLGKNLHAPL